MTHDAETVARVAVVISQQCYEKSEGEWQPSIPQAMDMAEAALADIPPQEVSDYQQGFNDGCNHIKEDYEAGERISARSQEMSVQEAAKVLLGKWLLGEFENDADALADDVFEASNDSTAIIEAWLRALAGEAGE